MKIVKIAFACLMIALPLVASIAGVDGKWSGAVATPNGDLPVGFVFKADGTTLTGSMIGPDGSPSPIANGKIDGNNLTFTVELNFNGQVFPLSYKGVLDGEQINMSSDFQGQPFQFVVKKVE